MPPLGSEKGAYDLSLGSEIRNWNRKTRLGIAFGSSAGFTLPNDAFHAADDSLDKQRMLERGARSRPEEVCLYLP